MKRIAAILLFSAVSFPAFAQAQQDCSSLVSQFQDKERSDSLDTIVALGDRIVGAEACPVETRRGVGRRLALLHVREAGRMSDKASAARLQLLERGARYAKPWQLMAMVGDLHLEGSGGAPDLKRASEAYEAALDDIKDVKNVPTPPPRAQIERLLALSQQVRLASNEFIPGGSLSTRDVRGVSVEAVPVPIKFVRNSDVMTSDGMKYADEAEKQLKAMKYPTIRLVGHTDPDGSDDYNVKLSIRRAEAVKKFLIERGYPAQSVQVEGRGRREPLRIVDEKQFNKDQIFEIQRRVEVRFL